MKSAIIIKLEAISSYWIDTIISLQMLIIYLLYYQKIAKNFKVPFFFKWKAMYIYNNDISIIIIKSKLLTEED